MFIVVALGSGIGLSLASPIGGRASTTLAAIGAVWLVLAQAMGFACGGFLSGRLRAHFGAGISREETRFRDGAQGFLVWALAVFLAAVVSIASGAVTLGMLRQTGSQETAAAAPTAAALGVGQNGRAAAADPVDYYVDMLFRTAPRAGSSNASAGGGTTGEAGQAGSAATAEQRAEASRILQHSLGQGRIADEDRNYLAELVAEHTGLSQPDAMTRVNSVEAKAREDFQRTADTIATGGAYLSFWIFMSLLFGAVVAILAGILGGELRDAETQVVGS
jgi:hypothetical protein